MNKLIIVFHETLVSSKEVDKIHQSFSPGVSYHFVIERNGDLTSYVPTNQKAYGAGDSVFLNKDGEQESISNSVDDFALHIALESPFDSILDTQAKNRVEYHSGYTMPQYKTAAWVIAQTGILDFSRVTTHDKVRLLQSEEQIDDPRCFNLDFLISLVSSFKLGTTNFDFGLLSVN